MDLWIPITVAAAFSQNLRFMLQKHLRGTGLSTAGATFARFLFAAPLAGLVLWLLVAGWDFTLPEPGPRFWVFVLTGGVAQILATMLVVTMFTLRNFAVGITFKKTETIQTALVGLVVLGEGVSAWGLIAIVIGLVAGLVGGLAGIGGSIIMLPALALWFGGCGAGQGP